MERIKIRYKYSIAIKFFIIIKEVQYMKRTKKYLISILAIVMLFLLSGCVEDKKSSDRTSENCSFLGTASVYGTAHQINVSCIPDGDGWYNPAFGHHHHK